MAFAIIAIGSNVGDRLAHLRAAVEGLATHGRVDQVSHLYETAPMYVTDQPAFLNGAVRLETTLGPLPLLRVLKAIEQTVGRQSRERFGPREVDLDLIGYGVLQYRYTDGGQTVLELPHPRTPERRFVLQPVADLDPEGMLPGQGRISELLAATIDQADHVRIFEHELLPVRSAG